MLFSGSAILFPIDVFERAAYRGFRHGSVLGSLGKSVTHVSGTFCHPCLVTLSLRRYP